MLKPKYPELHRQWRYQQEKDMKKETGGGMSKGETFRFVELYLPFTYLCYDKINPDLKLMINEGHEFYELSEF
jgi:pantothenate kinase-related protein Tda10